MEYEVDEGGDGLSAMITTTKIPGPVYKIGEMVLTISLTQGLEC